MAPRKPLRPIETLTAAFIDRLSEAMERAIDARARMLAVEWSRLIPGAPRVAVTPPVHAGPRGPRERAQLEQSPPLAAEAAPDEPTTLQASPAPAPRRRPRMRTATAGGARRPTPALPPDPAQEARHAELARLRAVLKPAAPEDAPAAAAAPASVLALDSPADPMRALEDEVREQMQGLAQLPPAGYTAQLAAWAGRVRAYEEGTGNRIAARFLLDKLRALAHAMEAGRVEALSPAWRTSDWAAYVEKNQALAKASPPLRPPAPSPAEPPAAGSNDADDPLGVWR